MTGKHNTNTKAHARARQDSPDVKFLRIAALVAIPVLLVCLSLNAAFVLSEEIRTNSNRVLFIFACAQGFLLVYINWTNYFWQRDTEQKHSLLPLVLSVLYFAGCIIFTIWRWS